jgi:hypothetical protein
MKLGGGGGEGESISVSWRHWTWLTLIIRHNAATVTVQWKKMDLNSDLLGSQFFVKRTKCYQCRIPDPNFPILDPRSRVKKAPAPVSGPAAKNLSIFNPTNVNYDPDCFIPDPKSRGLKGTGSRILNTPGPIS